MCESCGDPLCIVQHYDMDGNKISLQEWKALVDGMREDPARWERAKIAYTAFDKPPVQVITAWMGITRGEEPPPVWQTNVMVRAIPLSLLLKFADLDGSGELEELRTEGINPGNVLINLETPITVDREQLTYTSKEAALAGHDQAVARIRSIWSEFHDKHGIPEQLRLEDSPGNLEDWDFEVTVPQVECSSHDPDEK